MINGIGRVLTNPFVLYDFAASKGLTNWVPDEVHLKLMYRAIMGCRPDLNNPTTFNEKLQWLKLHDHNPLYPTLVDKYRVKQWISDKIGEEYVTKTYGVWSSADEIDISTLPEKFVLKVNHDSGGIAICRDRANFDFETAKNKLNAHLGANYFWRTREWPYKNVKPCVFAEEYLEPNDRGDLPDYKLFRFNNGRIIALAMTDRFTDAGLTETFFDEEWHPLDVVESGHPRMANMPMPRDFELMKKLANELAAEFPFMRVDFYESGNRLYFGEMTFYPNSGFEHFDPEEWNGRFGSWIKLPGGGVARCE